MRTLEDDTRVWVSDFDDTLFVTISEPSPSGIGVNEAYQQGIKELFGIEALGRYLEAGGHKNRTPAQIVQDSVPDMPHDDVSSNKDQLVAYKLDVLMDQIGTRLPDGAAWPRPSLGLVEFMSKLSIARSSLDITTAIVSAGHPEFILKAFDTVGFEHPDILITDEVIEARCMGVSPDQRAKPARFPMVLLLNEWASIRGEAMPGEDYLEDSTVRDRIIYTGDDPKKDGAFAENCGVKFQRIFPLNGVLHNWGRVEPCLGLDGSAPITREDFAVVAG